MTNQEAIKYLRQLYPYGGHCWLDKQRTEAIGMAINALQEEPVSEDLEEAIDTYLATYWGSEKERLDWPFLKKMAIYFAEWQKQKDSIPVSEELEEALAKEWKGYVDMGAATVDALEDNTQELTFAKGFYRGAKWQKEKEYTCYEEAFEDGAKWKKEQLMKDAISAKVTEIYYPTGSCLETEATLPESRFKDGDEVLIIKND